MFKIITTVFLVACAQAIQYDSHQATSFININDNHNAIHHIQSAPAFVKAAPVHYAAPAPISHYAAPSHYAAAPAYHGSNSYSSHSQSAAPLGLGHYASSGGYYASPVANFAIPAPVAKIVAPVSYSHAPAHEGYHHEEYAHPKYEFAYGVEDHHTGDFHSHKEARDGDVTHGEYSLHEADGTIRTVKYSVDKHSGFNAIVERSGHASHDQPARPAYAAAIKAVAAPVSAPHYNYHH